MKYETKDGEEMYEISIKALYISSFVFSLRSNNIKWIIILLSLPQSFYGPNIKFYVISNKMISLRWVVLEENHTQISKKYSILKTSHTCFVIQI